MSLKQAKTLGSSSLKSTSPAFPLAPTPYNTYADETYGSISTGSRNGTTDDSIVPVLSRGSMGAVPF